MKYLNFRAKNLDCTKIGGLELVKIGYCIITNLEQQRWSKLMHIFLPGVIPIPQNAKQGNESWGKVTNHHFLASSISFRLPAIWKHPLAQVLILIENLLLLLLKNCLGKDDRMLNMCWPPRNPLLRTVFLESVNFSNPNRAPTESSSLQDWQLFVTSKINLPWNIPRFACLWFILPFLADLPYSDYTPFSIPFATTKT